MKNYFCITSYLILVASVLFAQNNSGNQSDHVVEYTYIIINKLPHDYMAYTQGLAFDNGYLYEGTGRRGQSSLRKVNPDDGAVIEMHLLDENLFGEGITLFDGKIYQLTWQAYTGFVYDQQTFLLMEEFFYNTEGWGITHNGESLIVSDGSATLYFLDPATFEVLNRIQVSDNKGLVSNLNELEYINGEVFSNVLYSNRIARIDPQSGKVIGWIDLTGILGDEKINHQIDVLNGIAYDPVNDRLFVTGKLWPKVFEIKLIRKVRP
jgi:glutamine cyclotransferase